MCRFFIIDLEGKVLVKLVSLFQLFIHMSRVTLVYLSVIRHQLHRISRGFQCFSMIIDDVR